MANGITGFARGRVQLPDCHGRPTCDPVPVCPACGELECLCRPRFFAGQLLTEEDLNRLDYYVRAKNRLHNRHLHGWGVVCGLEVICGVCEPDAGHVVVKPGYALSPCGNDIVVCKTESVNICDLIARCRPPADDCHDALGAPINHPAAAVHGAVDDHDNDRVNIRECGEEQEWVLAICYTEKPSRAMAALKANVCDCGCGCGGGCGDHGHTGCGCDGGGGGGHTHGSHGHGTSGGCSCGCKGGSNGTRGSKPRAQKTPRNVPEQCEPTVTCESYRFVVYKAPKKQDRRDYGAAARRFLCCIEPLFREFDAINANMTPAQAQQWVISFRDAVHEFIIHEGLWDCELAARLAAITIPKVADQAANNALAQLNTATEAIAAIAALLLQKCFCAALLPPCPEPSQTDCVPLATVTVARDRCRVLRICNISARKFLVTIPNISYWLSIVNMLSNNNLNFGAWLRMVLERMCCRPYSDYVQNIRGAMFFRAGAVADARGPAAGPAEREGAMRSPFASILWNAIVRPERPLGAEHVVLGMLDARDAQGKPFLTEEELAHPSELLMLNQVVAPMLRELVPEGAIGATIGGVAGAAAAAAAPDARVDDLAREMTELRSTIEHQQRRIAELERRG